METEKHDINPYMRSPKSLVPNAVDIPLVAVTRRGEFDYYVAPELFWYLDYIKFVRASLPMFETWMASDIDLRFGIYVVDDEHEEAYFRHLEPYKRSCKELREMMNMCVQDYELNGFNLELIIDFDGKRFLSYYLEPKEFEKYIPDGWSSEYRPIRDDEVPVDKRFWIEEDGSNLFEKLYEELGER